MVVVRFPFLGSKKLLKKRHFLDLDNIELRLSKQFQKEYTYHYLKGNLLSTSSYRLGSRALLSI